MTKPARRREAKKVLTTLAALAISLTALVSVPAVGSAATQAASPAPYLLTKSAMPKGWARISLSGTGIPSLLSDICPAKDQRTGACSSADAGFAAGGGLPTTTLLTATTTTVPTTATTAQSSTAHVGATLSFQDEDGTPYTVQLGQVIDPAQGADEFSTPNAGDRFVATVFKITDTGASPISDDANNNSTVVGSDDQDYTADFDDVSECTNFNDGEYQITAGQSSTGCVVFQLPIGVTVAQVQWSPSGGFGGSFGAWDVP